MDLSSHRHKRPRLDSKVLGRDASRPFKPLKAFRPRLPSPPPLKPVSSVLPSSTIPAVVSSWPNLLNSPVLPAQTAGDGPRSRPKRSSRDDDIALRPADPEDEGSQDSGAPKQVQKHPATFQCNFCPKRFTRAYNFHSHLRTHTNEKHAGEQSYVCGGELRFGGRWGCGLHFDREADLDRHFLSEVGRACMDSLLDEEAVEGVQLQREDENSVHGYQVVTDGGADQYSASGLSTMLQPDASASSPSPESLTSSDYAIPIDSSEGTPRAPSPTRYVEAGARPRIVQGRPQPRCWDHGCSGRQFSSFTSLLQHQRVMSDGESGGQPTLSCHQCQPPRRFKRADHLRKHQAHYRLCPEPGCGQHFLDEPTLSIHRTKHHHRATFDHVRPTNVGYDADSDIFDGFGAAGIKQTLLNTEAANNTPFPSSYRATDSFTPSGTSPPGMSGKRHKCPYCNTQFTRHHNLKAHLLTHSQEKPYVCSECSMRFRRLHDLKRHTKLHTGERPHVCPKCNRKFARGDALARHTKGPGGCTGRAERLGSFDNDAQTDESSPSLFGEEDLTNPSNPTPTSPRPGDHEQARAFPNLPPLSNRGVAGRDMGPSCHGLHPTISEDYSDEIRVRRKLHCAMKRRGMRRLQAAQEGTAILLAPPKGSGENHKAAAIAVQGIEAWRDLKLRTRLSRGSTPTGDLPGGLFGVGRGIST